MWLRFDKRCLSTRQFLQKSTRYTRHFGENTHNDVLMQLFSLPSLQSTPVKPGAHSQENMSNPLTHVDPAAQGAEEHSLMSDQ